MKCRKCRVEMHAVEVRMHRTSTKLYLRLPGDERPREMAVDPSMGAARMAVTFNAQPFEVFECQECGKIQLPKRR